MKTPTKQTAHRLAAVLSLAIAAGTHAGTFDWTGATDNYWKTTSNWNASGSYGNRTLPTNDDMVFKMDNFDTRFTDNAVVFDGAYKNTYRTFVRKVGSADAPLVFKAASATDGMQFSKSKNTFIADQIGPAYLRFESGKWSTADGSSLEIGSASYTGNIVLTDGAVFDVGKYVLLKNGRIALENGTMNVANSGCYFGIGANVAATLELATGGTLCAAHISDRGQGGTVLFNGGTFKAAFVNASGMMSDNDHISVKVGANGGTIDANSLDVLFTRPIAPDGASDGGMAFKGGGSVTCKYANTYTGATTVEVGTTLVVPAAIAGEKLAFTIPVGLADGVYEVVSISGGDTFAADVLDAATLPGDANARFFLNSAKTGIYCLYGEVTGDGKVWVGIAGDGRLSSPENWLDVTAPAAGDVLNFSAATADVSLNADLSVAPATMLFGTKVVTIAEGALNVSALTNANKLAIAQGASLTVDGDLVVCNGKGTFLHSNEGTVTIAGNAVCKSGTTAKQYDVITANTEPIKVGGFLLDRTDGRAYFRLESNNNDGTTPGKWVVGGNGFQFLNPAAERQTRFYIQHNQVTLYSSADWTLQNTGLNGTTWGDLQLTDNSDTSLTIDTSDYSDSTVKRTVTLEGRILAAADVTIAGCGTVIVATTAHNGLSDTTIASGKTLAVTDTATLQVNAGKEIAGDGTISLAAGTTLRLMTGTDRQVPTFETLSLALPAEGTATLRIDGETPLKGGEYDFFNSVPAGYADHLTVTGTALGTRRAALTDDGEHLVLSVPPTGLSVIIR